MQLPEPALLRSYRVNDQNSWESLSWDRFCSAATTLYPPWHCVQIAFGRAPLGVSLSSCVYADVKSPVDDRVGTGACKLLSSLVVTIRWAYLGPFDLLLFNFISILLWYGLARLSERSRSLGKIFIQVRHVMFCCAYVVCMYVCGVCAFLILLKPPTIPTPSTSSAGITSKLFFSGFSSLSRFNSSW